MENTLFPNFAFTETEKLTDKNDGATNPQKRNHVMVTQHKASVQCVRGITLVSLADVL